MMSSAPLKGGRVRSVVLGMAKSAVASALVWHLWHKGLLSPEHCLASLSRPVPLFAGIGLIFVSGLVGSTRWLWLLRAQGLCMGWFRAVELSLVGNFLNLAVPGAVAGELLRGYQARQGVPGQANRAFSTVIVDRIIGLTGLLVVAAGATFLSFPAASQDTGTTTFAWTVRTLACVMLGLMAHVLLVAPERDGLLRLSTAVVGVVPVLVPLRDVYLAIRQLHAHPRVVMQALALSLGNQVLVGMAFFLLLRSLGETGVSLMAVLSVFGAGLLSAAVPLTPAGVGTGNAAMAYLLALVGSARGGDLYTLFLGVQVVFAVVGALLFLRLGKPGMVRHQICSRV